MQCESGTVQVAAQRAPSNAGFGKFLVIWCQLRTGVRRPPMPGPVYTWNLPTVPLLPQAYSMEAKCGPQKTASPVAGRCRSGPLRDPCQLADAFRVPRRLHGADQQTGDAFSSMIRERDGAPLRFVRSAYLSLPTANRSPCSREQSSSDLCA
jgi:hypothetical protein